VVVVGSDCSYSVHSSKVVQEAKLIVECTAGTIGHFGRILPLFPAAVPLRIPVAVVPLSPPIEVGLLAIVLVVVGYAAVVVAVAVAVAGGVVVVAAVAAVAAVAVVVDVDVVVVAAASSENN